jgi:hypothetical protein
VDGQFNYTGTDGQGFNAALFDARGLYFGHDGSWQLISGTNPVVSSFYATSITDNLTFLDGVITPVPEVGEVARLGCVVCALGLLVEALGRWARRGPSDQR